MDTAPDAPAASTLDERRPKGTPEHELASFSADSAEAAEPEKPEEEKKSMVDAERSVGGAESPEPAPSSTQPSRETGPDSAAAPLSPPASDRNATTSAQAKTSAAPKSSTAFDPNPQSQTFSPKAQIALQDDQRPQGTAPINVATMAVGALTGAFRRPETRSQPPTRAAPADPRPSAPHSLLHRFAVKTILETLRGPQDQIRTTPKTGPEAATAGATAPTNATRAPTTNAAASPGGLRDKLTTFTAERMQPRRDAEQVRDVTQAATGVIASLQALERQETTGILTRIRDAAKTNGGIENVLSEMRPGGQFEDLRKEFNTILSHDQGFAAAYDKATGAIADYAETRAALAPASRPRGDPNLARLQTLDQEIAQAAKALPGIKDGQSAFEDLVESGKEVVQKLFSAVQQTFNRSADLRSPSPSPGFGR